MGHCLQAIVAELKVADSICARFPELARVESSVGFSIIPIDSHFIDSVSQPGPPPVSDEEFMLLTGGFCEFLKQLSQLGSIAYIETEYFGGTGGQGAAVYDQGAEVKAPKWSAAGEINTALALVGVPKSWFIDRFATIGLRAYRSNDDLLHAASTGRGKT